MNRSALIFSSIALVAAPSDIRAQVDEASVEQIAEVTPEQLFQFAAQAEQRGDLDEAESAYRALSQNRSAEYRNEARFRLAMMLANRQQRYRDAALLLREILNEDPDAARVRVELARMQAMMGNLGAAERELRAAQAAGLPPQVERLVRFYAQALSTGKPIGFSAELTIAPDTNINQATSSDTLETIIGDFDLDEDAQARSGIGLGFRGQAYARTAIDARSDLLVRVGNQMRFYAASQFDDYALTVQAGPEIRSGSDRLSVAGTLGWRWFGQDPYSWSYGATSEIRHPSSKTSMVRANASIIRTKDRLNGLRDNTRFSLGASHDRAFSGRFGGGVSLSGYRARAEDPGYSTAGGTASVYAFRELGKTSLAAQASYSRLEADRRLVLYPERRIDNTYSGEVSANFRGIRWRGLSPLVRFGYSINKSTVEIYAFEKASAQVGLTAAF